MALLFKKILIANRGEIALRVLRSLDKFHIAAVAIYHDSDRRSPVVRQAAESVEIFGESPTAAYLDIEQILRICEHHQVDAVHPGYGFLSESAKFARALEAANIRFIGPSADVIELMGDKIASRKFVAGHGFPVPPSVTVDSSDSGFIDAVSELGYPVMVKASAGGGGKGISIVESQQDLAATLRVASSEAETYFGNKQLYVERYFERIRHIEVQVVGDGESVIHLGERECSIQRRYQKIIEEAPSPALDEALRTEICAAAVGIAKAAGYQNAGTVEFLYTPDGDFFFLEMNTRIQVEHPVTEMVYGVDLVELQLRVAAGEPLMLSQQDIAVSGHAIECRIYAEDAFNEFLPETGKVLFLKEPSGEGIRFDSGLYAEQIITAAFDPLLAKLIVHAPNRELAIRRANDALKSMVLLGVKTNSEYLSAVLQHSAFASGAMDTAFVITHERELKRIDPSQDQIRAALAVAYLADRQTRLLSEATPEIYFAIGRWMN